MDAVVDAGKGRKTEIVAEHINELRAMPETLAVIAVRVELQGLCHVRFLSLGGVAIY